MFFFHCWGGGTITETFSLSFGVQLVL